MFGPNAVIVRSTKFDSGIEKIQDKGDDIPKNQKKKEISLKKEK